MFRFDRVVLIVLVFMALLGGASCREKKGNSDALIAVLVARAAGLKASESGTVCADGGNDCPVSTEGGLNVFPTTESAPVEIEVSGYSCRECMLGLFRDNTDAGTAGGPAPLSTQNARDDGLPVLMAVRPTGAVPESLRVWVQGHGTPGWLPEPDARLRLVAPRPSVAD